MAKTEKTCIVCGTKFLGTAKAKVCTHNSNCRVKLKRLLAKGEKPQFTLVSTVKIKDLTKPTIGIKNLTIEPPKTNYSTHKPFMNDAIRKKLGL